jgi:hypothetical protein
VLNLVPELEKAGITCEVLAYPHAIRDKFRMLFQCKRHHLTYLQKKIPTPFETCLIKVFSRKLVFDFDDAIYYRHEAQGGLKSRSREIKTRTVLRLADAVVAGNRILKEYAETYCRNVKVVPSAVEMRGTPFNSHRKSGGPLVIGWIGSRVNLPQLALLTPVLQNLAKCRDIELHIVCDSFIEMPGVRIKPIPWSLETQESSVAGFDIGVMPLPASAHAEGKCGYKAIQCMAAAVPVVVSDVGINRELIEQGVDGFVAGNLNDFEANLKQLIDSAELRCQMGNRGRDKVNQQFSVAVTGQTLARILNTL